MGNSAAFNGSFVFGGSTKCELWVVARELLKAGGMSAMVGTALVNHSRWKRRKGAGPTVGIGVLAHPLDRLSKLDYSASRRVSRIPKRVECQCRKG